tara:strand:+ start:223 stop:399 length:177 start_codon:yes stop_codon:yes gene_type:complete
MKYILSDKNYEMFFEKDGVLSSEEKDAKRFNSEEEVEKKSIEMQLIGSPTSWIHIVED